MKHTILNIEEGNYNPDILTGKINILNLNIEIQFQHLKDNFISQKKLKIEFIKKNGIYIKNEVVPYDINDLNGDLFFNGEKIRFIDLWETLKIKNNYKPETFFSQKNTLNSIKN